MDMGQVVEFTTNIHILPSLRIYSRHLCLHGVVLNRTQRVIYFTFTRVCAIFYSSRGTSFFLQNHIRECPVSACHSFHSVTIKFLWDVTSPNFVGVYQILGGKRCFYFQLQANFQATSQSSKFHYYRFQKLLS